LNEANGKSDNNRLPDATVEAAESSVAGLLLLLQLLRYHSAIRFKTHFQKHF